MILGVFSEGIAIEMFRRELLVFEEADFAEGRFGGEELGGDEFDF